VPNKGPFNQNDVNPLPVREYEFRSSAADSAATMPYALDPNEAWAVGLEFARIYNLDEQPLVINSALQVRLDISSGQVHHLRVIINGASQTFTGVTLVFAKWYQVVLVNDPAGKLSVYLDGVQLGVITYSVLPYTPDSLIIAGGGGVAGCRCAVRDVRIGDGSSAQQHWQIDDGITTLKNTGVRIQSGFVLVAR
jgi:hypothetical protein